MEGRHEILKTISENWTFEERIAVATALLGIIQSDIPAYEYGYPGHPNITSVLHVLHQSAALLNQYRDDLVDVLVGGGVTKLHQPEK